MNHTPQTKMQHPLHTPFDDGGGDDEKEEPQAIQTLLNKINTHPARTRVSVRNGVVYAQRPHERWAAHGDAEAPPPMRTERYRGLLQLLRKHCWPHYDFRTVSQHQIYQDRRRARVRDPNQREQERDAHSSIHGKPLGILIHDQVATFVEQNDTLESIRKNKYVHEYTRRVLRFLFETQHMRPLACEVPVFDPALNVGTQIDMLCVTLDNQPIVVELKTEHEDFFDLYTERTYLGDGVQLDDSPISQALLQAEFGRMMLNNVYGTNIELACVILVNRDETRRYEMQPDMRKALPLLYDKFSQEIIKK